MYLFHSPRHSRSTAAAAASTETERDDSTDESDEPEFAADETLTMTDVAEHPAVHSITGVYKIVGMAIVSVSTLKRVKANEYEVTIKHSGAMGLQLVRRHCRDVCLSIGACRTSW